MLNGLLNECELRLNCTSDNICRQCCSVCSVTPIRHNLVAYWAQTDRNLQQSIMNMMSNAIVFVRADPLAEVTSRPISASNLHNPSPVGRRGVPDKPAGGRAVPAVRGGGGGRGRPGAVCRRTQQRLPAGLPGDAAPGRRSRLGGRRRGHQSVSDASLCYVLGECNG